MNKLINIDAIIFDLVGVLIFQKDNYQPNELIDEIDTMIGQTTDDNIFRQNVLEKFHLQEDKLNQILVKIVNKYEPFQTLWGLLPKLQNIYKLAIINNGSALTLPEFDKKLNFNKYFSVFVSSAKTGVKKPDKQIYTIATKQLGIPPEKCLFLDDSKTNIDGAKAIGMKTILWKNKNSGFVDFFQFLNS